MSTVKRAAIFCGSLLILCMSARAKEKEQLGIITVTGEAEVRVVPDEVILSVGLETWDFNLDSAKSLNDKCAQAVIDASKKHGVDEKHVQTDYMTIEPQYEWRARQARDFIGYFVRKRLIIKVKDVTKFEAVLADALDKGRTVIPGEKRVTSSMADSSGIMVLGGAINVLGVQFRTTELRKHRDNARSLAIKAAREKAVALAEELGKSIGEPTSISENPFNYWEDAQWYSPWWGSQSHQSMSQNVVQSARGEAGTAGEGMSLGEIPVKARITVAFELFNRDSDKKAAAK